MSDKRKHICKINVLKHKRENYDLFDQDYLSKLSPKDASWLADFLETYYEGKGSGRDRRRTDVMYSNPPTEARKNRPSYSAADWNSAPTSSADPETILIVRETIETAS
jgi:hypothetical protein